MEFRSRHLMFKVLELKTLPSDLVINLQAKQMRSAELQATLWAQHQLAPAHSDSILTQDAFFVTAPATLALMKALKSVTNARTMPTGIQQLAATNVTPPVMVVQKQGNAQNAKLLSFFITMEAVLLLVLLPIIFLLLDQ